MEVSAFSYNEDLIMRLKKLIPSYSRMSYRTVKKQKNDRIKLPDFQTRTVVVWGLNEQQKQAAFVRDIISLHAKIEKITIIKRKPAIKVKFRTVEDAIRIRSNRKIFKAFPNIYLKYGKDGKTTSLSNSGPDEEMDLLANLAGKTKFKSNSSNKIFNLFLY